MFSIESGARISNPVAAMICPKPFCGFTVKCTLCKTCGRCCKPSSHPGWESKQARKVESKAMSVEAARKWMKSPDGLVRLYTERLRRKRGENAD